MRQLGFLATLALLLCAVFPAHAADVDIDELVIARDFRMLDYTPVHAGDTFPEGVTAVYAIVEGSNLDEGDELEFHWTFENDDADVWVFEQTNDDDFRVWTNWSNAQGFEEGDAKLEVIYEGDVIAETEFEFVDDEFVYPVRFGGNCSYDSGILYEEGDEFSEIYVLYARIDHANFSDEDVTIYWADNGEVIEALSGYETTFDSETQDFLCLWVRNDDVIPDGDYSIMIYDDRDDLIYASNEIEVDN